MPKKIYQIGENTTLRQKAQKVLIKDMVTPKIKKIIDDMKKSLENEEDGVAIAAPQIGINLRIFVVSGKAFNLMNNEDGEKKYPDMVFINPIIEKTSKKKVVMDEGCLSVRGKYGKVERSEKTTIIAFDENGKKFKYGGSGLLSQIFQHETDHLDGVLFIDKATEIEEV